MEIRPMWTVGIGEHNLNVAVLENHEFRMRP